MAIFFLSNSRELFKKSITLQNLLIFTNTHKIKMCRLLLLLVLLLFASVHSSFFGSIPIVGKAVDSLIGFNADFDIQMGMGITTDSEVRLNFQELVTSSETMKQAAMQAGEDGRIIARTIADTVDRATERFERATNTVVDGWKSTAILITEELKDALRKNYIELKYLVAQVGGEAKALIDRTDVSIERVFDRTDRIVIMWQSTVYSTLAVVILIGVLLISSFFGVHHAVLLQDNDILQYVRRFVVTLLPAAVLFALFHIVLQFNNKIMVLNTQAHNLVLCGFYLSLLIIGLVVCLPAPEGLRRQSTDAHSTREHLDAPGSKNNQNFSTFASALLFALVIFAVASHQRNEDMAAQQNLLDKKLNEMRHSIADSRAVVQELNRAVKLVDSALMSAHLVRLQS